MTDDLDEESDFSEDEDDESDLETELK